MAGRGDDPAGIVAALAAQARRAETPCGDGWMLWHEWGKGAPLVLLHGGYGSWTHWLRNIPALAARRRVIAADLPGCGDSASAPEPYTAESLAAIVGDGIRRVLPDGEAFDLVGFSFGGLLGGHVAAGFGARCRTLVLVGAGGLGLPRSAVAPLRSWRGVAGHEARAEIHRGNLAMLMLADPARIDALAVHLQALNAERGRTKSPLIAATDTLARVLPRVAARLAGIWGERDATAMADLAARARLLRAVQPGAPFLVIAGAGHWVQYEAADAFDAALLQLLG
ncbi:MAG TPA: alpha/beta fold hydrolase [Stellaceae bacterium]|nr:alpha/beta fold hydrolase [Stellaceae bacterium]